LTPFAIIIALSKPDGEPIFKHPEISNLMVGTVAASGSTTTVAVVDKSPQIIGIVQFISLVIVPILALIDLEPPPLEVHSPSKVKPLYAGSSNSSNVAPL
jgi:hypothetical protein